MVAHYFKSRKTFDFRPHPFELGNILGLKKGYEDNHFLLKVYNLDDGSFYDYYVYHLQYYLSLKNSSEKDFFSHAWQITFSRIAHFERKNLFSAKHSLDTSNIRKLRELRIFLAPLDNWNIRPNDMLIKEKEKQIEGLRVELEILSTKLSDLEKYEVSVKPMVQGEYLPTFIDLLQQMRNVTLRMGGSYCPVIMKSPITKWSRNILPTMAKIYRSIPSGIIL